MYLNMRANTLRSGIPLSQQFCEKVSMNTFKTGHKAPGLQKSRMRHTWVGALLALAVIVFSRPVSPEYPEIFELSGHLLLIAALLSRMLSSLYIGGRKNASVVDQGPYSVVRNPLYVSSLAAVAGVGLSTNADHCPHTGRGFRPLLPSCSAPRGGPSGGRSLVTSTETIAPVCDDGSRVSGNGIRRKGSKSIHVVC